MGHDFELFAWEAREPSWRERCGRWGEMAAALYETDAPKSFRPQQAIQLRKKRSLKTEGYTIKGKEMAIRVLLTDELLEHLAALYQSLKGRLAFLDQGPVRYWADADPPTGSYFQAIRKNGEDGWSELHLISYSYLTDLDAANQALRAKEPWQKAPCGSGRLFRSFWMVLPIWQQPGLRLPLHLAA